MDGSTQTPSKQKFTESEKKDSTRPSDSSLFATYLVPLRLMSGSRIVWENPRPSSTFFCRPVRFKFTREDDEVTKTEYLRVSEEIDKLEVTKINDVTIRHKLLCTMIDGKVCNAVADCTSTQRCYLCGALSSEFNDLDRIYDKPVNEKLYQLGLSTLHAWIRIMEFLLHLAYKLGTERFSAENLAKSKQKNAPKKRAKLTKEEKEEAAKLRKEEEDKYKKQYANRKQEVQEKFRARLGILVDFVKQDYGTSNDGNCARKFFEYPEITSEITGIDENIIKRFKTILQVLVSGKEINSDKYDAYAKETAKMYVHMYSWGNMTPTVHKILVHGAEIISKALVPIGHMSEEAQESMNKHFRKVRSGGSRGISRLACNEDILHALLISSDPYISMLRYDMCETKKRGFLDHEAADLCSTPSVRIDDSRLGDEVQNDSDSDNDSDEDSDTDSSGSDE